MAREWLTRTVSTPSRSTRTYRYLRLSVVLLAVFLAASVVVEMVTSDEAVRGSISAYYYTPVRSAFVGTLIAMGLGLIAIQGRDWRGEDVMMNLTGILAPIVAVIPTPVPGTASEPCPGAGVGKCVPTAYVPGVDNNVRALLVVGVVALVVLAVVARSDVWGSPVRRVGYGLTVATVVVGAVVFEVAHEQVLDYGHYAAAIPMFLLMVAVAVVNGQATDTTVSVMGRSWGLGSLYRTIAMAMLAVLVGASGYWLVTRGDGGARGWLLAVEAALLALFACFWAVQTAEFWDEGLPEEVPHSSGDRPPTDRPLTL